MREIFQDSAREDICAGLRALGVEAQMVARGRAEEKIGGKGSLGLIDIPEGPIRWVNVRRERIYFGGPPTPPTIYYTEYGVPDFRLGPNFPKLRIKLVYVKTFPWWGKIVDLRWKGKDLGLGIIGRLNSDLSAKQTIMRMSSGDVTIHADGGHRCWIISTYSIDTCDVPSGELWACYQAIARHLLAEWSIPYSW